MFCVSECTKRKSDFKEKWMQASDDLSGKTENRKKRKRIHSRVFAGMRVSAVYYFLSDAEFCVVSKEVPPEDRHGICVAGDAWPL